MEVVYLNMFSIIKIERNVNQIWGDVLIINKGKQKIIGLKMHRYEVSSFVWTNIKINVIFHWDRSILNIQFNLNDNDFWVSNLLIFFYCFFFYSFHCHLIWMNRHFIAYHVSSENENRLLLLCSFVRQKYSLSSSRWRFLYFFFKCIVCLYSYLQISKDLKDFRRKFILLPLCIFKIQ